jgi:hypothetical protein
LKVHDAGPKTDVNIDNLTANSASIKGNKVRNLKAKSFALTDLPDHTDLKLAGVRAEQVQGGGATIAGCVRVAGTTMTGGGGFGSLTMR